MVHSVACPRAVLERQQELRAKLEREPVEFLGAGAAGAAVGRVAPAAGTPHRRRSGRPGLRPQRDRRGQHVLRSLSSSPATRILVTSHDYNACRNVACYAAGRNAAVVVEAAVPLPITSPGEVAEAVLRLGQRPARGWPVLDHITSPTVPVFPIKELVRELDRLGHRHAGRPGPRSGDGAVGPGAVALADHAGNCHKAACAPKGAGFLYVRRDRQATIQPPTISHGFNRARDGYSPLQDGFDWPGTLDPTPWICVGDAIGFLELPPPGGLPALMRRNHELALLGRRVLRPVGLEPIGPEAMLGSMASFHLTDDRSATAEQKSHRRRPVDRHELLFRHRIELPIMYWPAGPKRVLRIPARKAYNCPAQYERLAGALCRGRKETLTMGKKKMISSLLPSSFPLFVSRFRPFVLWRSLLAVVQAARSPTRQRGDPRRACRGAWPNLVAFGRLYHGPARPRPSPIRVHLAVSRWFWPAGGCGKSWPPRRGSTRGMRPHRWRGYRALRWRRLRGSVFLGDGAVHWHRARVRVLAPCGGDSLAAGRANSTKCTCSCQYINLFVYIYRARVGQP